MSQNLEFTREEIEFRNELAKVALNACLTNDILRTELQLKADKAGVGFYEFMSEACFEVAVVMVKESTYGKYKKR